MGLLSYEENGFSTPIFKIPVKTLSKCYILTSTSWEVIVSSLAHITLLADEVLLTRTLSTINMTDVTFCTIHITVTGNTVRVTIVPNTTAVIHKYMYLFTSLQFLLNNMPNLMEHFMLSPRDYDILVLQVFQHFKHDIFFIVKSIYSQLLLSRIPRDSLKHFRDIRTSTYQN